MLGIMEDMPEIEVHTVTMRGDQVWCPRHIEPLRSAGMEGVFGATREMFLVIVVSLAELGHDPAEVIPKIGKFCCYLPADVMEDIYTRHAILN